MGKLELDITSTEVLSLAHDVERILSQEALNRTVTLQVVSKHDRLPVKADAPRLKQVILNLASNAVKFSTAGYVSLVVEVVSETEVWATIRISVRDTGVGIRPDDIPKLFQPFSQLDQTTGAGFGTGTGLGLALSQRIVQEMGSKIEVESSPGKGSTFSFQLRLQKADPRAIVEKGEVDLPFAALTEDFAGRR